MAARSETERIAVARQRRTTPQQRLPWGSIAKHGILISTCGVILFPLAWVLLLSVKSLPDAYTNRIWPHHFDFGSYHRALTAIDTLPQNFENSIVVTVATMVITTTIAVLAGYALVHLPTPGKRLILGIFVASLFVPSRVTGLISIWEIQDRLGLINNTWGLILPYQTLALAVSVFIMRGVFLTIPKELYESARVDGASEWRIFWNITFARLRPILLVLVVLRFGTAFALIDEYILTGGFDRSRPTYTWTVYMWDTAFQLGDQNRGYAATIGWIGTIGMLGVVLWLFYVFRNKD